MKEWIALSPERRAELLALVSKRTGLPANAVEKDWWVTLALYAVFQTEWADQLVFKGGTSLSKAWNLIERFSEDIDLVLGRDVLGFGGDLSNQQIKNLRKASFQFISGDFREGIIKTLIELGIPEEQFSLTATPSTDSDRDPQVLQFNYISVLEKEQYLKEAVLIEVGARSLREPAEQKEISSIISQALTERNVAGKPFKILTVTPPRTFLEKMYLLHEEFSKPEDKIRNERMSRHLYDLDRIMDTEYGKSAILDKDLQEIIIIHRQKFNAIRGLDYTKHAAGSINIIPPEGIINAWEKDYKGMQAAMIYGNSRPFHELLDRMRELLKRFGA